MKKQSGVLKKNRHCKLQRNIEKLKCKYNIFKEILKYILNIFEKKI